VDDDIKRDDAREMQREWTQVQCDDAARTTGDAGDAMRVAMNNAVRSVVTCEGLHPVATMKHLGPLELTICDDPQCAHIIAKCTHQVEIPEEEDTVPRKFVKSICEWNEDGTILTCTFCGKDGT